MKQQKLGTELVGLAGEYFVAAQLCRRGLYAQLTLGNHKSIDLLVESRLGKMLRVSVKTKTGGQWMKVRGITNPNEYFVFVDLASKEEQPPMYILSCKEWRQAAKAMSRRRKGSRFVGKTNTVSWAPSKNNPKGWVGHSFSAREIERYRNNWKVFGRV